MEYNESIIRHTLHTVYIHKKVRGHYVLLTTNWSPASSTSLFWFRAVVEAFLFDFAVKQPLGREHIHKLTF